MARIRLSLALTLLAVLAIAGCTTPAASATLSPAATASAAPTASPATTSAAATTVASSPSLSAGCITKATYDLLLAGRYTELTPAQLATLVSAVEALVFAPGSRGASWRDFFLAEARAGRWINAAQSLNSVKSGEVALRACP
jgi:hypothetical protein